MKKNQKDNNKPLWTPEQNHSKSIRMNDFKNFAAKKTGEIFKNYSALHHWSVNQNTQFWQLTAEYFKVKFHQKPSQILSDSNEIFMPQWFSGSRLNFAENLLQFRDNRIAIEFHNENGVHQSITYAELFQRVASLSNALQKMGLQADDRVAAVMPNIPEAVIAMLACARIGAIWSICSPDFGEQNLMERFKQIEPRFLLFSDGYYYKGKRHDILPTITRLSNELTEIKQLIALAYIEPEETLKFRLKQSLPQTKLFNQVCQTSGEQSDIDFPPFAFNHPLYILYSSGTTGVPKCIVHGAGGTLLQHLKELGLHTNLHRSDKLFYYTSTGWMMWNWLVSGLALGVTIILYDGSPCYPETDSLLKLVARQKITVFGCSAKYISTLQKQNIDCRKLLKDSQLRSILSTGSPLLSESFDYVYEKLKKEIQLCSISGGTDLISCFVLGNPLSAVHRGELQGPGLGMAVKIYNEQGQAVNNEQGELVCTKAFPSMPVFFWNDPDNKKYHQAYFEHFKNVWTHGDYAKQTSNNGFIIYGRSDTTLNPGGIRIGTAEIYRQLEHLESVIDSVVVAQEWQDDQRIILFVQLLQDKSLDTDMKEALFQEIRQRIRHNCSPHHVPAKVIAVADIPHTYNGKLSERAVTEMIHNRPVKNKDALSNPESLSFYKNLEQLKT